MATDHPVHICSHKPWRNHPEARIDEFPKPVIAEARREVYPPSQRRGRSASGTTRAKSLQLSPQDLDKESQFPRHAKQWPNIRRQKSEVVALEQDFSELLTIELDDISIQHDGRKLLAFTIETATPPQTVLPRKTSVGNSIVCRGTLHRDRRFVV